MHLGCLSALVFDKDLQWTVCANICDSQFDRMCYLLCCTCVSVLILVLSFLYMSDMFTCRNVNHSIFCSVKMMLMIARLVACFMGTTDGAIAYMLLF